MGNSRGDKTSAPEQLLPLLEIPCPDTLPALMAYGGELELADDEALLQEIEQLEPWGGYGIQLRPGIITAREHSLVARNRLIFRSHLITGTLEQLLGAELRDVSVIDLACNHGYFALEAAYLGARTVHGCDLRAANIAKAEFLKDYFGIKNVSFTTGDVYDLKGLAPADIVYNLGLFYHVTDPWRLMQLTYDLCKEFAVIDSIMHRDARAGFELRVGKDNTSHSEGAHVVELQPTYRAMIELMRAVGFRDIREVAAREADDKLPHHLYDTRQRRCLIGFK